MTLTFDDGAQVRTPLRAGLEVDNWTTHKATESILAASALDEGKGAHIDVLSIGTGGGAERLLTAIVLESIDPAVSIPLFAVTLETVQADVPVASVVSAARRDLVKHAAQVRAVAETVRERGFEAEGAAALSRISELAGAADREPFVVEHVARARAALAGIERELSVLARKRRFAKVPDLAKDTFPNAQDYMIVLERFPLWAEQGWHERYLEDPSLGYFGQGGDQENSLRTLGNFVFTCAVLATTTGYDPDVSGVSQETLLGWALKTIRYMTRSHVTGDLSCANGKKWGNHWQSAWWTSKMAAGARLLWGRLSESEQESVTRVIVHEADRHLSRKAPSGEFRNTRSEENAWDSEILAWAACLFPDHEHALAWEAKAREFFVNTLSVKADRTSDVLVDGRPLRESVYTTNVHSDFTIENHGAYQFCYMACPLHSLTWAYYAYTSTGRRPPESLFHHFRDVWGVIRRTHLFEGRFAYLGGKDWARYVYGLYFIMPPLVMLQNEFGDRDARLFEGYRLKTFEWEQRQHGDGGMFSGRYTRNIMRGWPHEYETDAFALLALCLRLHEGRKLLAPADAADCQARVAGTVRSSESGWLVARSPELFASFSWRMLKGGYSMGLFVPAGTEDMVEWGQNNMVGTFTLTGVNTKQRAFRHNDQMGERRFSTTGVVRHGRKGTKPVLDQYLSCTAIPALGAMVLFDLAVIKTAVTIAQHRALDYHLVNDMFNGNSRRITTANGTRSLAGVGGKSEVVRERSTWLTIDDKVGIVCLGDEHLAVHDASVRNAPWQSILYERITWAATDVPADVDAGEVVRDLAFVFVSGDAAATRACAAAAKAVPTGVALCRAAVVRLPRGVELLAVANFGDETEDLALTLAGREVRIEVGPTQTVTRELR